MQELNSPINRFPWQPRLTWDIVEAARETGLGVSEDLTGPNITGFTVAQTISRNGVRLSAARAFLWPHRNRKNLHVALNATATRIDTTKIGKKVKATGITLALVRADSPFIILYLRASEFAACERLSATVHPVLQNDGQRYKIKARKEVILTAGAVNSPQLLLLSGIGPREHLKSVGIRTVVDLPGVGENLHNHASYGVDFTVNETYVEELNVDSADRYMHNQTGPMSSTGLAQLTGILRSNYTTADDPDIQIFFAGYQAVCGTGGRIADLETHGNKRTVRFTAVNMQTRSRGKRSLRYGL